MTALAPSALFMADARTAASTREGFAKLVAEHQRAVCAVAFSTLRDRAASEEIAQEAFLVAWKKLPGLAEPPKLPAWICGIARNLAKNAQRAQRKASPSDELENLPAGESGPLDELLDRERDALVARALESLDESQREPLILFYRHDMSAREVAAALDISEVNAKQRVSRARAQLVERVQALVERSLRSSGPGAAFTVAVMSAVAALPKTAQAQPATGVGTKIGLVSWVAIASLVGAAAVGIVSLSAPPKPVEPSAQLAAIAPVSATESPIDYRDAHPSPGPRFLPLAARKRVEAPAPLHEALDVALQQHVDLELREVNAHQVIALLGQIADTPVVFRDPIGSDVSLDLHAVTVQAALDDALEAADAVWDEIDVVRVVATPGPAGPALGGRKLDLRVREAGFRDVTDVLSQALEIPVVVADNIDAEPITVDIQSMGAGEALSQIVSAAGLRYEVVPAIEVRADSEDE